MEPNPIKRSKEMNIKPDATPRTGLDFNTAKKVAKILYDISDASAVVITDNTTVLAYAGFVCKNHPVVGEAITTITTSEVLKTGESRIVSDRRSFYHCDDMNCDCKIESGVVAPLTINGAIIGTVKLYHPIKGTPPTHILKLADGAAQLLTMQVELAEKEKQKQLMIEAQLEALRAKINPHFLFNSFGTISMLIRTDPEQARVLLLKFSTLFRNSLSKTGHFISLANEIENTLDYLKIEKARFGEKLKIQYEIEYGISGILIPVLSIQPLVENAVIHGIAPKEESGTVSIIACSYDENNVEVIVSDNGVGIKPAILPRIKDQNYSSGSGFGVGLYNVDQRLRLLIGEQSGLVIRSKLGDGTVISFKVPKQLSEYEEYS